MIFWFCRPDKLFFVKKLLFASFFMLFLSACSYMQVDGLDELQEKEIISFDLNTSNNSALSFSVNGSVGSSVIDVSVPVGTDITSLIPDIRFSGNSITPSPSSPQDFSSPVNYVVTAENDTQTTYQVVVTIDNQSKNIYSFAFLDGPNADLSADSYGTVNHSAGTVSINVPYGTALTALVPDIVINGASISPLSGTARDFSSPVVYTVTAGDTLTKNYTVSVGFAPNTDAAVTNFEFLNLFNGVFFIDCTSDIDHAARTIRLGVPREYDVTALAPTITLPDQATVSPASGAVRDFSVPVDYTVTAGDGSQKTYRVSIYEHTTISLKCQSNNQFVCADNAGTTPLVAIKPTIGGSWESFDLIENVDGSISLLSIVNEKYVTAPNSGNDPLIATATSIGTAEKFTRVNNPDGSLSLISHTNGLYVSANNAGDELIANQAAIGSAEKYDLVGH